MTLTQSWVGYLDRSYEQIKKALLKRLGVLAPEISDHTESNPLIIIVSMFAGIAEMLNLYIDSIAREAFLGTARRYSSAVKLVKLIDYNIKARNPASVNMLFYLLDDADLPTPMTGGSLVIPKGSVIIPNTVNMPFVLLHDVVIADGAQNAYGVASQYEQILNDILGTTTGAANQKIPLSDKYVHGSLSIKVGTEDWVLYNSIGLMGANTKGFIVSIDELGAAYLQFGDGINGKIPTAALTVFGDYKECEGKLGNLPPDSIGTLKVPVVPPAGINLNLNNPDYASAGTNFETLEDIQNRAPRSIRTLERAVTYQDYVDLCYMVLGVGAAEVQYCCGKYVDGYIAPSSPGVATGALLQAVLDYLNCRVMLTTRVSVLQAGVTKIWVKANIYGKPLVPSATIQREVYNGADVKYGWDALKINRKVDIAEITTMWKSLPSVDRVEILEVRILPFARPIEQTSNPINIVFLTLPNTSVRVNYTLVYRSTLNQVEVYKDTFYMGLIDIDAPYADGTIITFKVTPGTYNDGDKWEFAVFPSYPQIFPTSVIEIKDYTAPIIEVSPFIDENTPRTIYSEINIIEQNSATSCLPACN